MLRSYKVKFHEKQKVMMKTMCGVMFVDIFKYIPLLMLGLEATIGSKAYVNYVSWHEKD